MYLAVTLVASAIYHRMHQPLIMYTQVHGCSGFMKYLDLPKSFYSKQWLIQDPGGAWDAWAPP